MLRLPYALLNAIKTHGEEHLAGRTIHLALVGQSERRAKLVAARRPTTRD